MTNRQCTWMRNVLLLCSVVYLGVAPVVRAADSDYDKKMAKLKELEEKKRKIAEGASASSSIAMEPQKLAEIIQRYEKLYGNCQGTKNERCADVMFNLGKFYYDRAQDKFVNDRAGYEKKMDEYDRNPTGPEPINPLPNYSESVRMYRKLIMEYPSFGRNDEAYYQIGHVMLLAGEVDSAKFALDQVVEKFPNSPRASMADFTLGDFANNESDYSKALRYYEKVRQELVAVNIWEMTQYRKAELSYNIGDFDKAIALFFDYVEKCDAGAYPKKQFREMALEYMAITFSDMPQGAEQALKFFKKAGARPYEAYIIYTIGAKNRDHGQFDDAIFALRTALKTFPYYKDAPIAQHRLVECLVVKKQLDDANVERERLVDVYGQGGDWYSKNQGEKAILEQAQTYVNKALGNICLYLHATAMKKKDKSLYEKALKRYNEFFKKFPEDKWRLFEFKYNAAEIYNELQQYEKAVDLYWFVAMEDVSKYPAFRADIDSLLYDDPKEYEEAVKNASKTGAKSIVQSDAGYNAIVALDNARKKKVAREGIADNKAYNLPETQKMIQYVELYQQRFPNSQNVVDLMWLIGNMHYEAKNFKEAISIFETIGSKYASSQYADKASRMLAKTYSASGEYDLALKKYRELLARTDSKTKDFADVAELAAGTLYGKAEDLKKAGNSSAAADAFRAIYAEFPTSKVAERGLLGAASCYEEAGSTELAAEAYMHAASSVKKADFAIPTLNSAAKCYEKIGKFDKAAEALELTYQLYATDPKTPMALYNAGLYYEKAKMFDRAIRPYMTLAETFPKSEYAEDAFFAVGESYEKLGDWAAVGQAFSDFSKKFPDNRAKQVEALSRAGDAYLKLGDMKNAEANLLSATTLYDSFRKKGEFDVAGVARAYCKLGEIYHDEFKKVELKGANERAVKDALKEKTKALEKALKQYVKAIETGAGKWVVEATFQIGQSYLDLGLAEKNQQFFGRTEEKVVAKIQVLQKLAKINYIKAEEKFVWNIQSAHQQNLTGEFIDKSVEQFVFTGFLKGRAFEEVGELFSSSPIPNDLEEGEKQAYREILEEKRLAAMDAAGPQYEQALKGCVEFGIAQATYLDSIRARLREINPESAVLNQAINQWVADTTQRRNAPDVVQGDDRSSVRKTSDTAKKPESASQGSTSGTKDEEKKDKRERRRRRD